MKQPPSPPPRAHTLPCLVKNRKVTKEQFHVSFPTLLWILNKRIHISSDIVHPLHHCRLRQTAIFSTLRDVLEVARCFSECDLPVQWSRWLRSALSLAKRCMLSNGAFCGCLLHRLVRRSRCAAYSLCVYMKSPASKSSRANLNQQLLFCRRMQAPTPSSASCDMTSGGRYGVRGDSIIVLYLSCSIVTTPACSRTRVRRLGTVGSRKSIPPYMVTGKHVAFPITHHHCTALKTQQIIASSGAAVLPDGNLYFLLRTGQLMTL